MRHEQIPRRPTPIRIPNLDSTRFKKDRSRSHQRHSWRARVRHGSPNPAHYELREESNAIPIRKARGNSLLACCRQMGRRHRRNPRTARSGETRSCLERRSERCHAWVRCPFAQRRHFQLERASRTLTSEAGCTPRLERPARRLYRINFPLDFRGASSIPSLNANLPSVSEFRGERESS